MTPPSLNIRAIAPPSPGPRHELQVQYLHGKPTNVWIVARGDRSTELITIPYLLGSPEHLLPYEAKTARMIACDRGVLRVGYPLSRDEFELIFREQDYRYHESMIEGVTQ